MTAHIINLTIFNLPNSEDTASFVKVGFTRDTTNALFKNRGNLSSSSLGLSETSSGNDTGLLQMKKKPLVSENDSIEISIM